MVELTTRFTGKSVLIVDDNQINLIVAEKLFSSLGINTEGCLSGPACMAHPKLGEFDAILMDVHMPGMDGFVTTDAIRTKGGIYADLPIIACSADTIRLNEVELNVRGFSSTLAKPITRETICIALDRAL